MKLNVERRELKYHMRLQEAILLQSRLSGLMERDPHSDGRGYFIRSMYFDSCFNTSYHEKIEGIERRTKYRLRIYDFKSSKIKLEMKSKINNTTIKRSAMIRRQDLEPLLNGDCDCLLDYEDEVLRRIYYGFKCNYYKP